MGRLNKKVAYGLLAGALAAVALFATAFWLSGR